MKSIWRIIRSIIFAPSPDSTGLDELDIEEKSNDDRLRELYQKAAATSLLILNEDGTDIIGTPPAPEDNQDSKRPSRSKSKGSARSASRDSADNVA